MILDNAAIRRSEPMKKTQEEWAKKGLHLLYLPPYSPEFNVIEILWKQAKCLIAQSGMELQDNVEALMRGFGAE